MNHFDRLRELIDNCYAPYSKFRVASIAVLEDDRTYGGVNVESVAYPTTMCAERNAIFHSVTEGAKPGDIAEVHILAVNGEGECVKAYPCGACRQVIAELSRNAAKIHIYRSREDVTVHSIADLLPHAFDSLE
ncbi:cytidine deaminase [Hydrogenimonas urashimensis]|uniref:cytidine deaminase n=1 Tax=Hydrogenimonas urashimensis TaxID=2740515 RepID=UPI001915E8D9|nr:cytidine deaminase [Hydrogenimonas urashimensis]